MSPIAQVLDLAKQYLFYRSTHILFIVGVWGFYNGAVLRATNNNLGVAFLSQGVFYLFMYLGYLFGNYFLTKLSFKTNFNIANFLRCLGLIIAALCFKDLSILFVVTSAIIGLGNGWYWATANYMTLTQVGGSTRSRILSVLTSLELGSEVGLGIIIGLLVSSLGYEYLFIIAGFALLLTSFKKWHTHTKSSDVVSIKELNLIIKNPNFKYYFLVMLYESFSDAIKAGSMLILPFYFINQDLNVGLFLSGMGLFGAVFAYLHRRDVQTSKVKAAYFGSSLSMLGSLGLAIFWQPWALVAQSLSQKIATATYQPVGQDLQFTSNALLIKNLSVDGSLELLLLRETIYFVARMLLFAVFIALVFIINTDVANVLRVLIVVTSTRELTTIFLQKFLIKKLQVTPAMFA